MSSFSGYVRRTRQQLHNNLMRCLKGVAWFLRLGTQKGGRSKVRKREERSAEGARR